MYGKLKSEAFDQKGCEHNSNKTSNCVDKPSGGESCAFDGAYIVLNPIRDAVHIVHGGITCGAHNYESRGSLSSGSNLYRYGFSTDISELEIIYGAEDKLYTTIRDAVERFAPSAVFVYITCTPAMTGEETEAVCKKSEEELGIPVIPVTAPGFLGHKNLGNRLAGEVLLNRVIGTQEPDKSDAPSINIIGEYNIAGDLWNVLPLFKKIGIHINAVITGDEDYNRIAKAHGADFNLIVCSRALINLVSGMKDRYGIDFSEVSFFGLNNTKEAYLVAIEKLAQLKPQYNSWLARSRELVLEEAAKYETLLKPYKKKLSGKKAVIYSGGVKSWSLIPCLQDLGIEATAVGIKKAGRSDQEKIKGYVGEKKMVSDTSAKNIVRLIKETQADFFIAGSRNQYLAYKERVPYIDVNQERVTDYGGFAGIVNFARDLCRTLETPVWDVAKEEAPWLN